MANDKKNHTKKNSKHIVKAQAHREEVKQGANDFGKTKKQ